MMLSQSGWRSPPTVYGLPRDEVHVWRARLEQPAQFIMKLEPILSPDERERMRRFRFELHRVRWIVSRGLLRTLLGRYLDAAPETLSFNYSRFGKPELASIETPLRFNVSHSGELLLIAMTLDRAIGVDIEQFRADLAVVEIAERFFSASEQSALTALPVHLQHDAFFDCWTRKEAFVKANDHGLSLPLHQFDVAFLPGQRPQLLATRPDAAEVGRWSLEKLDVARYYKAAVAVEGSRWALECWDWPVECSPGFAPAG